MGFVMICIASLISIRLSTLLVGINQALGDKSLQFLFPMKNCYVNCGLSDWKAWFFPLVFMDNYNPSPRFWPQSYPKT